MHIFKAWSRHLYSFKGIRIKLQEELRPQGTYRGTEGQKDGRTEGQKEGRTEGRKAKNYVPPLFFEKAGDKK